MDNQHLMLHLKNMIAKVWAMGFHVCGISGTKYETHNLHSTYKSSEAGLELT